MSVSLAKSPEAWPNHCQPLPNLIGPVVAMSAYADTTSTEAKFSSVQMLQLTHSCYSHLIYGVMELFKVAHTI